MGNMVGSVSWPISDSDDSNAFVCLTLLAKAYKIKGGIQNHGGYSYGNDHHHYYVEYSGLQLAFNIGKKKQNMEIFLLHASTVLKILGLENVKTRFCDVPL